LSNKETKLINNNFWEEFLHDSQDTLRAISALYPSGFLNEQTVPAYLSSNPLARFLFWKRLRVCIDEISRTKGNVCLDFGCGSGVMLPILSGKFQKVIGVDIVPEVSKQYLDKMRQKRWIIAKNINIFQSLQDFCPSDNFFDLILALDVLEHVEDLDAILSTFHLKLKSSGILLVSGPTENILYKLGRKIVGFSGHYHRRTIYNIQKSLKKYFDVRILRRILFPFTLFLVLKAAKKQ